MSTAVELSRLAADKSICRPQPRTILCQGLSTLELRVLGVRRLKRPPYAVNNCLNIYSGFSLGLGCSVQEIHAAQENINIEHSTCASPIARGMNINALANHSHPVCILHTPSKASISNSVPAFLALPGRETCSDPTRNLPFPLVLAILTPGSLLVGPSQLRQFDKNAGHSPFSSLHVLFACLEALSSYPRKVTFFKKVAVLVEHVSLERCSLRCRQYRRGRQGSETH